MYDEISVEQDRLSTIWPEWRIIRKIGRGSFGTVYEIVRNDLGKEYTCALKILHMEPDELSGEDDSELREFTDSVVREIDTMMQLKGAPNIVSIEDYHIFREEKSCTIMIRMEILEGLNDYISRTGPMQRQDVARLGIDICKALEFCEQLNILHRDIKPGNIFYSEKTGFKLGDFGISRTIDLMQEKMSLSRAGAPLYMAPEVYFARPYDNTIDIYSLGIVLYIQLNDALPPFVSKEELESGEMPRMQLIHFANMARLKGEKLPPPANAGKGLEEIILKACDPVPQKRYRTAAEFKEALSNWLAGEQTGTTPAPHPVRRNFLVAAAVAAAGLIALSVLWKPQKESEDPAVEEVYYTILARDTNGETINRQVKEGKIGEEIRETAETIEGYTCEDETQTLVLSDNASNNIILFLYTRVPSGGGLSETTYSVVCVDSITSEVLSEKKYYGKKDTEIPLRAPAQEGYIPQTAEQTIVLSDKNEENVFYIMYDPYEVIAEKLDLPDGKVLKYNDHTYYAMRTDTIDDYWRANEYCAERGGHLAVIDDARENAALYDYVFYDLKYESAYFGLTDDGGEGDWHWVDGSDLVFESWNSGQPDNQGEAENYGLFYYKDTPYKWNDGDFGKDREGNVIFLIEWEE